MLPRSGQHAPEIARRNSNRRRRALDGHHGALSQTAKSSPERKRVTIHSLIVGNQRGPSPTDGSEAVSSPMGEAAAKSPSVAAVIPGHAASGPKSIRVLERGTELMLASRSDRPAIPPPQV